MSKTKQEQELKDKIELLKNKKLVIFIQPNYHINDGLLIPKLGKRQQAMNLREMNLSLWVIQKTKTLRKL